MGTVLIREFKALIGNIYAIVTAAVFSIASGILFVCNNLTLTYPSIDAVLATMSVVAAILIPVIACFSINGERKKGSDELLSVLPLTRAQIVLGKFFGILAFLMIPTGVIFIYPVMECLR
ncbi:MAG: ABC transporter permease subunit [Clostridia bacterium]|nr:ABC transporter permease subunit [Clostridia bacterium]